MSERGPVANFREWLKSNLPLTAESKRFRQSRYLARQAIIDFASKGKQEIKSTFEAGSPAVVDLTKFTPGAVLRIEGMNINQDSANPRMYEWLVVGFISRKGVDIFTMQGKHGLLHFAEQYCNHDILHLQHEQRPPLREMYGNNDEPDWFLELQRPSKTVFKVEEIREVIFANNRYTRKLPFRGVRLDVMQPGIFRDGERKKERTLEGVLVPAEAVLTI